MWVFNNDSFVSIVEDRSDHSMVFVRARRSEDLNNFFKSANFPIDIIVDPRIPGFHSDYEVRCHVSKVGLKEVLVSKVDEICYSNFKNSIDDDCLKKHAAETWNSGYRNLDSRY